MHLVPRLAAGFVSLFDLVHAAWLTAFIAALIVALIALFVLDASRFALRHGVLRFGLAGAIVLVPAGGSETTANLANIHWYLIFGCFWAFVSTDTDLGRLSARSTLALVAPLSSPLAALLLPVAFWTGSRRVKREFVPLSLFGLGLSVQGIVALSASSDSLSTNSRVFDPTAFAALFGTRVAGSFLIGDRFLDLAWRSLGAIFTYGSVLVLACIMALAVRRLDRVRQRLALMCIGEGLAFFAVPLIVRGTAPMWPPVGHVSLGASRYFVLPILFLLSALAIGLDARLDVSAKGLLFGWWTIPAVWFSAILLLNYSLPNGRSLGPDWATSLRAAERTCVATTAGYVSVPIAPGNPWSVRIPCP